MLKILEVCPLHVSLTPRLEEMVRSKVDSGLYNNASEVIRAALRLMANEDKEYEERLKTLREAAKFEMKAG